MRLVEVAFMEVGVIDGERDELRLFTMGLLDTVQTARDIGIDVELAKFGVIWSEFYEQATETQLKREDQNLTVTDEFELTLERDDDPLLSPLDSTVNYAVVLNSEDTSSLALAVEKVWE